MSEPFWVIETNVFPPDEERRLTDALSTRGIAHQEISSNDIRYDDSLLNRASVARGSCWMIEKASQSKYWNESWWGDLRSYDCSAYFSKAHDLLSADFEIMSFAELAWTRQAVYTRHADAHQRVFIRPDQTLKAFDGGLVALSEFEKWHDARKLTGVNDSTKVLIAKPKTITYEWRCIVADGKAITGSQYRPSLLSEIPKRVADFVEAKHMELRLPQRFYVMDVAEHETGLKIIEVGCLLCVAFYHSKIEAIIDAIC